MSWPYTMSERKHTSWDLRVIWG